MTTRSHTVISPGSNASSCTGLFVDCSTAARLAPSSPSFLAASTSAVTSERLAAVGPADGGERDERLRGPIAIPNVRRLGRALSSRPLRRPRQATTGKTSWCQGNPPGPFALGLVSAAIPAAHLLLSAPSDRTPSLPMPLLIAKRRASSRRRRARDGRDGRRRPRRSRLRGVACASSEEAVRACAPKRSTRWSPTCACPTSTGSRCSPRRAARPPTCR